jgi:flagellar basal-body rod protein FlgF
MSTKGIYTALSGSMAQTQKLDTIANNLANINTPAFKKDAQVFQEYLTAHEKPPNVLQVPKVPASIESFYDMQGGDKSFVDSAGTYTNFAQGSLKATNNPLDVAIDGNGFFEIATPNGVKYSRLGAFKLDGLGQLVTKDGHPLLRAAAEGTDPAARTFKVSGENPVVISEAGDVMDGENNLGKISVIDVTDRDTLSKIGGSLYEFKANAQPEFVVVGSPALKQGFMEMSNVNIVQEMTDMIQTTRMFESTQKAIQAYDAMSDKLINVVGSIK